MKNFKKVLLSTLLVSTFILSACNSNNQTSQTDTRAQVTTNNENAISNESASNDRLAKIKQSGVLTVCTEPYFAPYEFIDPSKTGQDQYVGFDMEIAKYIADKLGVKLQIVPLDFGPVLAGITAGKYDLAISAIAYSEERMEAMNLSDSYIYTGDGYGFAFRTGEEDKWTDVESLKDAVVITQSGSVQEGLYNKYVKNAKEFKLVANMTDGYLAVMENKADVCIVSKSSAALYAEANDNKLTISEYSFPIDMSKEGERIAATKEGTDSLIAFVNECIAELKAKNQIEIWRAEAIELQKSLGIE